jgi:hypothetical protein
MKRRSKLLLAASLAVLIATISASMASANNLGVSSREIRIIWNALTFNGGPSTIICPVSLLGSFHRDIMAKDDESLFGAVTSAKVGSCQGDGRATILQESLPWHIVFDFWGEELPAIETIGLRIVNNTFRVSDGVACLVRSDLTEPIGGFVEIDTSTGVIDNIVADPDFEIDLDDPGFLCDLAGDSFFTGTGSITTAGGGSTIIDLA